MILVTKCMNVLNDTVKINTSISIVMSTIEYNTEHIQ